MKKLSLLALSLLLQLSFSQAQVSKKMIVEHFTNTLCGICANRNPGLTSNLNANPQVQRITINPSSPYSSCFLSQQNAMQNDARANYYGVFGGTPKLVINGSAISTSQNYADAAMFTPFISQSNFTINVKQFAVGIDSIRSEITIKRIAAGAQSGNASLFAALVEDTVFGNGGNGELLHFNVMRRALFTSQGQIIALPMNVNDSLVLNKTENFNTVWNSSRMRTVAILQEEVSKLLIQSELSSTEQISATTALAHPMSKNAIKVYPNPANSFITIKLSNFEVANFTLSNQLGQVVINDIVSEQKNIDVSDLPEGIYFVKLYNSKQVETTKVLIKH
jgi:hypothetical protein